MGRAVNAGKWAVQHVTAAADWLIGKFGGVIRTPLDAIRGLIAEFGKGVPGKFVSEVLGKLGKVATASPEDMGAAIGRTAAKKLLRLTPEQTEAVSTATARALRREEEAK